MPAASCTSLFLGCVHDTVYRSHLLFCHTCRLSTLTYTHINTQKPELELHSLTASAVNTWCSVQVTGSKRKRIFFAEATNSYTKYQTHNQMLDLPNTEGNEMFGCWLKARAANQQINSLWFCNQHVVISDMFKNLHLRGENEDLECHVCALVFFFSHQPLIVFIFFPYELILNWSNNVTDVVRAFWLRA